MRIGRVNNTDCLAAVDAVTAGGRHKRLLDLPRVMWTMVPGALHVRHYLRLVAMLGDGR